MQTWLQFWLFFFWLSLSCFLFNPTNFLNLLMYSEITWLCLYCLTIFLGSINDDISLLSTSFFILAFAGVEFSFGFLLVIMFKNFNFSFLLNEDFKIWNQLTNKKN